MTFGWLKSAKVHYRRVHGGDLPEDESFSKRARIQSSPSPSTSAPSIDNDTNGDDTEDDDCACGGLDDGAPLYTQLGSANSVENLKKRMVGRIATYVKSADLNAVANDIVWNMAPDYNEEDKRDPRDPCRVCPQIMINRIDVPSTGERFVILYKQRLIIFIYRV